MSRWFLVIALLIVVAVAGGIFLTRAQVVAAPEQPSANSHRVHVDAGVQCLFCHSSARVWTAIPSVQNCMGCHVSSPHSPLIQEVLATGNWGSSWVRVNSARLGLLSHQPHRASLNCESCHGDVGQMEVVHRS
jgi:hypothetical protein